MAKKTVFITLSLPTQLHERLARLVASERLAGNRITIKEAAIQVLDAATDLTAFKK